MSKKDMICDAPGYDGFKIITDYHTGKDTIKIKYRCSKCGKIENEYVRR